jgi:ABC-2 type transport system permease protein
MRAPFSSELFRLVRRPAVWVLLATWLVLFTLFSYALPYLGSVTGDTREQGVGPQDALASTMPDQLVANALGGTPVFAGALALILGVLVVGSEDGWGTLTTLLVQRPSRLDVLGGKLGVLVAAAGTALAVTFATGAAVSATLATVEDEPLSWPPAGDLVAGFGAGWLVVTAWCLVGAALATVLRGVALPIGLGVVWVLAVENLVSAVAGSVLTALQPVRDLMPGANAGSLVHALTADVAAGAATPGITDAVSGGRAAVTLTAYVVVSVAVAAVVLRRRDVA